MKKGLYFLFILCLAGLISCVKDNEPAPAELVRVGDAVPAFSVLNSDGGKVEFAPSYFSGKRILVVFFSTTCPDCQRELPKIQAAWNVLGTEGLELIAVARAQDAGTVAEFWAEKGFTMPWYTDPDRSAYSKFATTTIPRLYLAVDGKVKWKAIENLDKLGITTGEQLIAKINTF